MSKRALKKLLDAEWGAYQHRVWKRCAVCGETPVEAHHLITKRRLTTCWDVANGIGLCEKHHKGSVFSAHGTPWAFKEWLRLEYPEQWSWWQDAKERVTSSISEAWLRRKLGTLRLIGRCL